MKPIPKISPVHRWMIPALVCAVLLFAALAMAKKHRRPSKPKFDYYVLSLSWAPTFCNEHPGDTSRECRIGGHTAFVLHGLWPQADNGPPPLSCAPPSQVDATIVDHMLQYFPNHSLVQHEWTKHGTCTKLSMQDYFDKVEQAFKAVQLPTEQQNLDHAQKFDVQHLEESFATANNAPEDAFRVACRGNDLVGVDICLDKDLHYRECSASVRECAASQVLVRPPR